MLPGSTARYQLPSRPDQGRDEEPLYVNAKQYHRILKRRQARAKLEADGKIPKIRKVGDRTPIASLSTTVLEHFFFYFFTYENLVTVFFHPKFNSHTIITPSTEAKLL